MFFPRVISSSCKFKTNKSKGIMNDKHTLYIYKIVADIIYETVTTTWFSTDLSNEISFALPSSPFEKRYRIAKNTYFFVILSYFAKRSGKKSSTCYFIRLDIFFFPSNYEDKFLFNFIIACIALCRSITTFANKNVMFLYEKNSNRI